MAPKVRLSINLNESRGVHHGLFLKNSPLVHNNRLEPLPAENGLVGPDFIETLAFGVPAILAVLEEGGGVTGLRVSEDVVRLALEMHADECQENSRLAVPRPEHFVMPTGVFPANPFERIDLGECPQKMGLKALPLHPEMFPGLIDVHLFRILTEGTTKRQPADDDAGGHNDAPDDDYHA